MNSIHNNGDNDKSLNDDLDQLGHAYQHLEREDPPELLDQAILNSAHRAVEKKPHWIKSGWLHGLTTAAVFVLAFAIVLNQRESAPVYEDGMLITEPAQYQHQQAAKKESTGQIDEFRAEMKVKSDDQRDMLQGKSQGTDQDTSIAELMSEEALLDEADLMADSPQAVAISELARPATIAEPVAVELESRFRTNAEAEEMLLAIIRLKQAGNDRWKTELESFMESYPDYPLPDELKD